jgi:hypothetical protein
MKIKDFKFKISNFKSTFTHFHSSKGIIVIQYIIPFFHHLLGFSDFFPPEESCKEKFSKIQIRNHVQKEKDKWSKFASLKRRRNKDTKEDPKLMANGRFHIWWPLKWIQCLEVNREAFCLVANGRFQALLEILFFATNQYATCMQLVIVCDYFGHVCNYKFHIV